MFKILYEAVLQELLKKWVNDKSRLKNNQTKKTPHKNYCKKPRTTTLSSRPSTTDILPLAGIQEAQVLSYQMTLA